MAGKFRHRVSNPKLKKRIPKGFSSESNPSCSRHREAARASRLASSMPMVAVDDVPVSSTSNADVVLQQLPLQEMRIGDGEGGTDSLNPFDAKGSMISDGAVSRFSAFTACTNPTFDAVHRLWKSGSAMQNDVIAVLAAVAELIKEENGEETDVEYFAALLTALDATPAEHTARLAATAYLLHLIVKKVSKEILQKYFSRTVQILYTKLSEQSDSEGAAVLKNLLSVLGVVLRNQPATVWHQSSTKMILVSVATFATHDKPRVRTMSRRVLRSVLTDPVTSLDNGIHPAAGPVGEFAISQLERCAEKSTDGVVPTRILCMVEGIMHKMPQAIFTKLAETILHLLAFVDGTVKCSALQCLYRVLQRQPSDAALPIETNAQLILAVRDFAPPVADVAVTAYWVQALGEAHVCLTAKDSSKSIELLPKTLQMFVHLFDAGNEPLAEVTSSVLMRLVENCIQTHAEMATLFVDLLDKALNIQSTPVWRFVLRTLMKAFQECGQAIEKPVLNRALNTLAELREGEECFCKGDLDIVVGAAIRHVGVDSVLHAIPLNIDADIPAAVMDFKRSWLLPVLRVNILNAPLSIFIRYFLPLAIKLHKKVPALDPLPAKLFSTLQRQLWELLPSFLSSACDFEKSFPEFAHVLGAALSERADLRLIILSSLRSALRFCLEPDAPSDRTDLMRRYAKNYLPILFNMYTSNEKSGDVSGSYDARVVQLATLDTVRLYVELTPEELIERYTNSAVEKAQNSDSSTERKVRVLDLLGAFARQANSSSLGKMFSAVYGWFNSEEAALQKKAFRILEEIFKRIDDSDVASFFEEYDSEISNVLTQGLDTIALSSRGALLSIFLLKLRSISSLHELKAFGETILHSVILCLDKSHSTHARSNAFKCLVELCQRLISLGSENGVSPSSALQPILSTIYEMAAPDAGRSLADVPFELARSTMVAMNIMAQKYVRILDATLLSRMISHACSWIGDGRPAVRVLVIRMLRVLTQKLPDYTLQQYRELLLDSVFNGQLTADVTIKVRKANRLLLEALVDRYGVEILMKSTDKSDWVKQLKAIEKIRRRKERRLAAEAAGVAAEADSEGEADEDIRSLSSRSARTAGADTILDLLMDSDEENDSGVDSEAEERKSRSGRSKANSVWLKEGGDEDMIDLLDRNSMIGKVTTVQPTSSARSKLKKKVNGITKKEDFTFTKDGRLVIADLDDDLAKSRRKRKQGDDMMEVGESSLNEKKRKTDGEDDSDDESKGSSDGVITTVSRRSGWKPGGQGIHRDTSNGPDVPVPGRRKQREGKKGTGDVKKKGAKFEPYAYIPLRKQKGRSMEMRKLIRGAKKGATKGSKGKRHRRNTSAA